MTDLNEWYKSIPIITRYWFTLTVVVSLLARMQLLNGVHLILYYEKLIHDLEIWRPLTATFFYPITPKTGFHFLLNLYLMCTYSPKLEKGIHNNSPADCFFMLLFIWVETLLFSLYFGIMYLLDIMVFSVLYIWCQLNQHQVIMFWFGSQFKAMYFPWILLLFNMIVNGSFLMEFLGIIVGHSYYFVIFKYPQEFGGRRLLTTPNFIRNLFSNIHPQSHSSRRTYPQGSFPGSGHTLGRN